MELKYRLLIGIVVLVVISGIVSSFSGGGDEEQKKLDADRGNDSGSAAASSSSSATSSQEQEQEGTTENIKRVTAEAKFKTTVVDPTNDPKILEVSSKLLMSKFDTDGDGKISAGEIPDGDLKTEMMGYDLDGDDILTMDEFQEYVKNR
jgi:hypothetical protein|tara:strand:+ start:56 stop:502 length:447 start_codon:yes stop_codon:yes gene_type:complete